MTAAPATIPDATIRHASGLLYRWTGMIFGEGKRYYVERRLLERMRKSGRDDPDLYLAALFGDADERQAFINAFTINETYFYREEHHLALLSDTILPALVARRRAGDLVRIWCMPCSTGEEAYSVAIWLLEHWRLVDAYNIEIVGSDIDTAALARARDGLFAERSYARLPAAVLDTYFEPEQQHRRRIIADLRESVRFTHANLIDAASVAAHGLFDVILCRNLLIYFDETSRRSAAWNLHEALRPGGYLCLGHSESMARISDHFAQVRVDDAIVYRRP